MKPSALRHVTQRNECCATANSRRNARIAFVMFAFVGLSACEQNSFVPPPPPKVEVAVPVQRAVTRYLEATGNTAPIKNVDLVARVQGFLQSINYKDGTFVKEGTTLFTIEPETYKLKLEQAQAAEAGAQASLKQAEADFKRQSDLVQRQAVSQATLDTSTVDARQRAGQSAAGPGQHQDRGGQFRLYQCRRAVRRHRQRASGLGRRTGRRGVADAARDHRAARSDLCELQRQRTGRAADPRRSRAARHDGERSHGSCRSRSGCRPRAAIRTRASSTTSSPTINQSTGTLAVRGVLPNPDRVLLPGYFVRVRVPLRRAEGRAAGSRCRARQRPGRPLCAGGERRQRGRAAQGRRPGRSRASCA